MTILIKNGDVTTKWPVFVRDSTTLQGATGKASTLGSNAFIGKQGGALAAVGGTFTEDDATKAPGLYLYTPTGSETNTNGPMRMTTAAASGCVISLLVPVQVVAFDPAATIAVQVYDAAKNASPVAGSYGEDSARINYTAVTGSLAAGAFTTSLASAVTNAFKNAWVCWLSGTLAGQVQQITANDDGTANTGKVLITVGVAFTGAPANTDRFIIVNR